MIKVRVDNHGENRVGVKIGGQSVNISGSGRQPVVQRLDATENMLYDTLPQGVDGWYPVNVNVTGGGDTPTGNIELQKKESTSVAGYATATVKAGSEGTPSFSVSTSGHSMTFVPKVTNTKGFIDGGTEISGASITVHASDLTYGSQRLTSNGEYSVSDLSSVVVDVKGTARPIDTVEQTLTSASSSITFNGVAGQPTSFVVISESTLSISSTSSKIAVVAYDGSSTFGQYITNTSNAQVTYNSSYFSYSYDDTTNQLTVSRTNSLSANFQASTYKLLYTTGNIYTVKTTSASVSNNSVITFSVDGDVAAFFCVRMGNLGVSTSSSYRYTHAVAGTSGSNSEIFGMHLGTSSIGSESFNNGYTFTQSGNAFLIVTNNSNYTFRTGSQYELVYVTSSGGYANLEPITVTATSSEQYIEPDTGVDGFSSVTVNAITQGNAGTPVASKSTVSNHSITITPTVTNSTGYITGGSKTGTAVTVTASELVSDTKSITSNSNNIDVTNYKYVNVQVPTQGDITDELPPVSDWGGNTFTANKTYIVTSSYSLPANYTLVIQNNAELLIDAQFTNNGTITQNGNIYISRSGSIVNTGNHTNYGTIYFDNNRGDYLNYNTLNNQGYIWLVGYTQFSNIGTFSGNSINIVDYNDSASVSGTTNITNWVVQSSQGSNELPPTSEWSDTTFTTDKDYVISEHYSLGSSCTLNVSSGTTLIVKSGGELESNGNINNYGRIINLATMALLGSTNNSGGIYTLIESVFVEDGAFSGNKIENVGADEIYAHPSIYNNWTIGGGTLDDADLYVGQSAPSGAQEGDYWIDTSDQSTLLSDVLAYTATTTTMTATGIYVTIPKSGTYTFKFSAARTGTSGTYTTQLYKGSVGNMSAVSGAEISWATNGRQGTCTVNVSCNQGDRVEIYSRTNSQSSYGATYTIVGQLVAYLN